MEIIKGKRNTVKIDKEYVLKIGKKKESARPRRLFIEGFAMKKLRSYGLNIPRVLNYGFSSENEECLKIEFIRGKNVSLKDSSHDIFNIFKDVGEQFRKIQSEFERFGWINSETLDGEFSTWNEYLYDFTQKYGFRLNRKGILKESSIYYILNFIKNLPNNLERASLVHRDLKPRNLIFNPKNKKVYICDWENVILGDPLFDLAVMGSYFDSAKMKEGFIKGFLRKPLNKIEEKKVYLYSIVAKIGVLNFNLQNNLPLNMIDGLEEQSLRQKLR